MIPKQLAQCYFLDVGHGASYVVLLPRGEGVLIVDGGDESSGSIATQLLRGFVSEENRIRALVVSHDHQDHSGGAIRIVNEFAEFIDLIVFPKDRPAANLKLYRRLSELRAIGRFHKHSRLARAEGPKCIHPFLDPDSDVRRESSVQLIVLAPSFESDLTSDQQPAKDKPNNLAAVIVLRCHDPAAGTTTRVLFTSDAGRASWQQIAELVSGKYRCEIATLPHHGGKLSKVRDGIFEDYQWLFSEVLDAKYVIVSAGTNNPYGHPFAEAIGAARQSGAIVICTQMTSQCCSELDRIRSSSLVPLQEPCRSSISGVPCASTLIADISASEVFVRRSKEHQQEIDRRVSIRWWRSPTAPLCRRDSE